VAVAYGWYSQDTNKKLSGLNMLKFSVWSSRGAGLVLAFDGAMVLVPSEWARVQVRVRWLMCSATKHHSYCQTEFARDHRCRREHLGEMG
jgi:hypothetical protein